MQLSDLKTLFRRIDPLIAIGQGIVVLIAFSAGGTITSHFHEATVGALTGIAVAWLSEKIRTAPKNPQNPPGSGTKSGTGEQAL